MDAITGADDTPPLARSYRHLPRTALPLALWEVHRGLAVGDRVELTLPAGGWSGDEAAELLHGAGFVEVTVEHHGDRLTARAVRGRTLADTVGPGMRLLLVGLNPSIYAADAGFGFARPGNRFWPALAAAGIHTGPKDPAALVRPASDTGPKDPAALVRPASDTGPKDPALLARPADDADRSGIGMTDLVKRATRRADELSPAELVAGLGRIERLAAWLQPGAVCFLGLSGWRAAVDRKATAGWQPRTVGGRPAYVMPNPSGLNAHATVATLADHLRTAWAGPRLEGEPT